MALIDISDRPTSVEQSRNRRRAALQQGLNTAIQGAVALQGVQQNKRKQALEALLLNQQLQKQGFATNQGEIEKVLSGELAPEVLFMARTKEFGEEKAKGQRKEKLEELTAAASLQKQGFDVTPQQVGRFLGGAGSTSVSQKQEGRPEIFSSIFKKTPRQKQKEEDERISRDLKSAQLRELNQKIIRDPGLTPGQKKVDQEFAKELVDFQAKGGFADVQKSIAQLEEAEKLLESGEDTLTGPIVGSIPGFARKRLFPKGAAVQASIEEVVQRNLRLVLGAQFTEKEGTRLIERAFDPALSEEENAKRVGRLIKSIKDAAAAKLAAIQHFNQFGSLKNFAGGTATFADFERAIEVPRPEEGAPPGQEDIVKQLSPVNIPGLQRNFIENPARAPVQPIAPAAASPQLQERLRQIQIRKQQLLQKARQ